MINPTKYGIQEYSKVNPERYPNLEKYFLEPDKNGRVSLECYGVNYVHLLKCREAEGLYLDIYAEELNIPDAEKIREQKKKQAISTPSFSAPIFDSTPSVSDIVKPIAFENLGSIFGSDGDDDSKPF